MYPMTELSREEPDGAIMVSEGNDRSNTRKRLLDDGARVSSMIGANPMRKGNNPGYESQNLAYMDAESVMSYQKGMSIIG